MYVNLLNVFLQAGNPFDGFQVVFLVGMVVVMYFFMIRPQQKKAKEQKAFGDAIGVGDKIITTAGIHATITRANEDGSMQIEVSRNSFMTIERSAISMELTQAYQKKHAPTADTKTVAAAK